MRGGRTHRYEGIDRYLSITPSRDLPRRGRDCGPRYLANRKIAMVSPYGNPIWKLPPAATAMYWMPLTV